MPCEKDSIVRDFSSTMVIFQFHNSIYWVAGVSISIYR